MTGVVRVHLSNRTERLADRLSEIVSDARGGPFDAETIVVQGKGMAVWLGQELSRRHRIAANLDLTYPQGIVTRALASVLGEERVESAVVSEDGLFFRILACLPKVQDRQELARVRRYLKDDPRGTRRFQLAERLATRFDQYLTFRPEMIRAWDRKESGGIPKEQAWQAVIWRALWEGGARGHRALLIEEYLAALRDGKRPVGLPERITLFGMTSLPPSFLRVIAALASHAELHVLAFSPALPGTDTGESENRLLASLGPLAAEFRAVLVETVKESGSRLEEHALHAEPDAPGMLGALQRSVHSGAPDAGATRRPLEDADGSISVHSCHGPMREVEVLHDQLLSMLTSRGSSLEPRDVVVLMPDVETYAPFVEAVFDRAPPEHRIPYAISDRSVCVDSPVIDAFDRILSLVGGRFAASQVLDLLGLAPVARRFGLATTDLEDLTEWVVESGVRWGMDSAHRKRHGQPEENQNTWQFGLDRLFVGYAMSTDGREAFRGVLPFEEIEGNRATLLGGLAEFTARLFEQVRRLEGARPLARWREDLAAALAALVADDRDAVWQHQRVVEELSALVETAREAGFDVDEQPLDLSVVKPLLLQRIDLSHPERGFLSRGVTFCAMLPMRSVPFRVVCLLGMNDGAFPRGGRGVDFDLIRTGPGGPRPGDRDRRKDDRFLLLEALMAARERLIVTYTGQSIRNNVELQPSVVVGEVLDHLDRTWDPPGAWKDETDRTAKLRGRLVTRHPLQPFSPRYFDAAARSPEARLFSYVESNLEGARRVGTAGTAPPPFFDAALPPPVAAEGAERTVVLSELVRFYEDPAKHLLGRRLGIYLEDEGLDVPEREPVELDALEKWRLGQDALDEALEGVSRERSLELARDRGRLPLGVFGALVHDAETSGAAEIAARVKELRGGAVRESRAFQMRLGEVTLMGELSDLWGSRQIRSQFSRMRPKYQLRLWIRHLVLSAVAGEAAESVLVGRTDKGRGAVTTLTFGRVRRPEEVLARLVGWYQAGLRSPLRFVPGASQAYAEKIADGEEPAVALAAARKIYGEGDLAEVVLGPHLRRVFGEERPGFEGAPGATGDFAELATEIFGPLLAARVMS